MSPILGIYASQISGHLFAPSGAYDSIATVTVGSPTATITFSSIPQTYTHLQVRAMIRSDKSADTNADMYCWLNSNQTQSNYTRHYLRGNGTAASSLGFAASAVPVAGEAPAAATASNIFGVTVIDILDYTNTNKFKNVRTLHGDDQNSGTTASNVYLTSSLFMDTSAITSLQFTLQASTNFTQYSSFALYGIKGN